MLFRSKGLVCFNDLLKISKFSRTSFLWLLALVLSGSLPAVVHSEQPDPIQVLDPFTVQGKQDPSHVSSDPSLSRKASSVGLVPSKDIKESRGYNFEDVFQFAPGVFFQPRAGGSDGKISIRGTNLSSNFATWGVTLLVDGLPMTTADGLGHFDSIELLAVEQIGRASCRERV